MFYELIFDLETKKLFSEIESSNPADLEVCLVSLYTRTLNDKFSEIEGKMQSFWERDFNKIWPFFTKANRIIGFNSLKFDVPALKPHTDFQLHKLNHFDILAEVKKVFGHRVSLNNLAKETLDKTKIDRGCNAVKYWQKHDSQSLEKLQKYCEMDVLITKEIYDFGLKNNYLMLRNKWGSLKTIQVNFSYPQDQIQASKQIGLF